MTATAVAISHSCEVCDDWYSAAWPLNEPKIVTGIARLACAEVMAAAASDSDLPGARSNEIVTAGNCAW